MWLKCNFEVFNLPVFNNFFIIFMSPVAPRFELDHPMTNPIKATAPIVWGKWIYSSTLN